MKRLIFTLVLSLVTSQVAAKCDNEGGELPDCVIRAMSLPNGHAVGPGVYSSGGTFVLRNAGCVSKNAIFRFHSAFYGEDMDHVKSLAQEANEVQKKVLSDYPQLLNYLEAMGAFDHVLPLTIVDGKKIHEMTAIPYC